MSAALFSRLRGWLRGGTVRALDGSHPTIEEMERHGTYPAPQDGPPPEGYVRIPGAYHYHDGRRQDAFVRLAAPEPFMLPAHCGLYIEAQYEVPPDYSGGPISASVIGILPEEEGKS